LQRRRDLEQVRTFQRKIYQKAKQEKDFRFYVLYDKVRQAAFLRESYKRCKANNGSAGVDGLTFKDIESTGVSEFLDKITQELANKTYKPQPVKRVEIPKANGQTRPLGIPTIKDRVIQMAVKLVIEPIFEADFEENSYGFRPKRCAADAITTIKAHLQKKRCDIYDADLSGYFDTIPHKELLFLVGMRISDKNVLHLIKMWLKTPIIKNGQFRGGKKNKIGTPQGGVISPLLANIYLNVLDKAVNRENGLFQKYGVFIVRYADDFVLMGKNIPKECLARLNELLRKLKLTLNKDKSKAVQGYEDSFDFLGHTLRWSHSLKGRGYYWNVEPSNKSQNKVREKIREYLAANRHKGATDISKGLNAITCGWINYFSIRGVSYPTKAKRNLNWYLYKKLHQFYNKKKSQRKCKRYRHGAMAHLSKYHGLIQPVRYTPKMTPVNATDERLSVSRVRENRMHGLTRRLGYS